MVGDFNDSDQEVTHSEEAPVEQSPIQNIKQESNENINWKRMREENERYKREAEDLKNQLDSRVGDDELVEHRHLKQMKADLERQTLELRLKNKYPDFDEVVNSTNLKKLAKEDPELAYTLDNTPDMYAKAVSAYKMIRANQPRVPVSEDDESFEENQYKPRNSNSLNQKGESPLSGANAFQRGISKDQKAQLWAEMQEAIKNK